MKQGINKGNRTLVYAYNAYETINIEVLTYGMPIMQNSIKDIKSFCTPSDNDIMINGASLTTK